MAKQGGKHVGRTIALSIVALLFAAVIAYGAFMAYSIKQVNACFAQAQSSYAQMQADVEAQEYANALEDARTAATSTSEAATLMEGWQWNVAAVLPMLGTDVQAARSLGSISNDLSQDAVLPVLESWDSLINNGAITNGQLDILKIPTMITQIKELFGALTNASALVDDCKVRVDAVPESHFDSINESRTMLSEAITSADEALVQFDEISQAISEITNAVSGVVGQ